MSDDRDFKIELINAYRKLLETSVKTVSKNENVQRLVQDEFNLFIEDRLNVLMGNNTENKLTEDEVVVLKALVANAQRRASNPTESKQPTLNKKEGTTVVKKQDKQPAPTYVPKNVQPPLGNKKIEQEQRNANQDILSRLDEMDSKFENEW